MSKTITAVFKSRPAAVEAVDELINAGFSTDDVSVLMTDETRGREFGIEEHTKAPEGAATGGITGALAGLGFKEHEAKLYADSVKEGSILVGVEAHDDRAERAESILDDCGGQHVC